MKIALTLIALLLWIESKTEAISFKPSHESIYRTEWNWFNDTSGWIQSTNPGAYLKFTVKNTKNVSIGISLPPGISDPFCSIAWTVDYAPMQLATLPNAGSKIQLTNALDPKSQHSVYLFIRNMRQGLDRWNGPQEYVRITEIVLDDGGIIGKDELQPKRLLVFWDSIGEGVSDLASRSFTSNDAHVTWAFALSDAIETELSLVAWGGQGYTVGGSGNVPPLFNASGDSSSGFQWLNSKVKRDFSICPDYVVNGHGTNDGLHGLPASKVAPGVLGWMKGMRNTCKNSKIFVVVPFGRFEMEAIEDAFKVYKSFAPKDDGMKMIKLGKNAAKGLDHWGANFVSSDGIHPVSWRSAALSAHIVKGIAPYL